MHTALIVALIVALKHTGPLSPVRSVPDTKLLHILLLTRPPSAYSLYDWTRGFRSTDKGWPTCGLRLYSHECGRCGRDSGEYRTCHGGETAK
jgi:hypothetical protein